MGQRNLLFFIILSLNMVMSTIANAVSIDAKANGALALGGDRLKELHQIQV